MRIEEFDQLIADKRANPNPNPSTDSYGSHNVMDVEADNFYKDADGNWAYDTRVN
jgi:hypothetical protein